MGKPYFQGWYFKMQSEETTLAFIPAKHLDAYGNQSASLQVVTPTDAYVVPYPASHYTQQEKPFFVQLGASVFGETGMEVNVNTPNLSVQGLVSFRSLTPLSSDIMGPFRYVPFMECRHSVRSMSHWVDGYIVINGTRYVFKNALGYIEGDRGRSFPREYVWTQCHFEDAGLGSLMLSVADIPFAGLHFTGVIATVIWRGRQYRLATYLGARAVRIGEGRVVVRQGAYLLSAQVLEWGGQPLQAPACGEMSRRIRESVTCKARYCFSKHGQVLFDLTTDCAAFEYEYGV